MMNILEGSGNINEFVKITERIQDAEEKRDLKIMELVMEQESLPVNLIESSALIQLIRTRDWVRQTL